MNADYWASARESLEKYRPKELLIALARLIVPKIPPPEEPWPGASRAALRRGVARLLREHAGWYTGPSAEALASHRFRHSRDAAAEIAVIFAVLNPTYGHLRALGDCFRAVKWPSGDPPRFEALNAAVRHLVLMVGEASNYDDDWHGEVEQPLRWLLGSVGVEVGTGIDRVIAEACGVFRSWMEPSDDDLTRAADMIEFAVVRAEFEKRYGRS